MIRRLLQTVHVKGFVLSLWSPKSRGLGDCLPKEEYFFSLLSFYGLILQDREQRSVCVPKLFVGAHFYKNPLKVLGQLSRVVGPLRVLCSCQGYLSHSSHQSEVGVVGKGFDRVDS